VSGGHPLCDKDYTGGVMYLFVRYGHLIRHGVAVPPSPTGEGFFLADVSNFLCVRYLMPIMREQNFETTVTNSLLQWEKVAAACRLTDEVFLRLSLLLIHR